MSQHGCGCSEQTASHYMQAFLLLDYIKKINKNTDFATLSQLKCPAVVLSCEGAIVSGCLRVICGHNEPCDEAHLKC